MMAYFLLAESSSSVLDQKITYAGGSDLNKTQDIAPAKAIVPGMTYTVNELMGYMIKYSDNNAAQLLYDSIDQNALRNVYSDLQIPVNNDATIANLDFITPQQIATLFRILYNGTYLSRDYSEEALKLMSESGFTEGLVAGVPSSTIVSHKLGLVGIAPDGITNTEHELHDCGIVYAPDYTYILCVMTRGSSPLLAMENTIADISKTVYNEVENNYR
jgi:beta-lactamase class A